MALQTKLSGGGAKQNPTNGRFVSRTTSTDHFWHKKQSFRLHKQAHAASQKRLHKKLVIISNKPQKNIKNNNLNNYKSSSGIGFDAWKPDAPQAPAAVQQTGILRKKRGSPILFRNCRQNHVLTRVWLLEGKARSLRYPKRRIERAHVRTSPAKCRALATMRRKEALSPPYP